MTLVYDSRSFSYNRDLSRFVDRHLSKMVSEESVFKSALLDVMWKGKETFTGDRLEWAMYRTDGTAGANIFFEVFGNSAGGDSVTAAEPDAYILCQADPRNAGRKIKLSKIKLAQASGKEAKISYIQTALRSKVIELSQGLDRAFFTGRPGNTISQIAGLDYTVDNGITHSLYQSQTRSNSRALVGNEISATSTGNAATTLTSCTVTNASVTIDKDSHGATVTPGDVVEITDNLGDTRWYYAISQTANTIVLSSKYEGATGSANASVKVYSVYNDANKYGSSGELTLAKVHRMYAMCSDGMEVPNFGVCHQFVWSDLRQLVLDTEYSISKSDMNRLGTSGFENYMVLDAPITVAGNCPTNKLYMLNTNQLKFKTLKDYGSMNLDSSGLRDLSTLDGSYSTLIGEVVVSGELCSSANNRHGVLTNISTD